MKEKTTYEKALSLLDEGIADKHQTYPDTGIIVINLGKNFCGYVFPDQKYVEVAEDNTLFCYGTISDDLKTVVNKHSRRLTYLLSFDIIPWD